MKDRVAARWLLAGSFLLGAATISSFQLAKFCPPVVPIYVAMIPFAICVLMRDHAKGIHGDRWHGGDWLVTVGGFVLGAAVVSLLCTVYNILCYCYKYNTCLGPICLYLFGLFLSRAGFRHALRTDL